MSNVELSESGQYKDNVPDPSRRLPPRPPLHVLSHTPVSQTSSNPLSQSEPLDSEYDPPKGKSLPRNVPPPESGGMGLPPPPTSYAGWDGGHLGRTASRPPSTVLEESREGMDSSLDKSREEVPSTQPQGPDVSSQGDTAPHWSRAGRGGMQWSPALRAARKGHTRSASHGGVSFIRTGSHRETHQTDQVDGKDQRVLPAGGRDQKPPVAQKPPSALKKPGHRRVFSHGQINPDQTAIPNNMKGHARVASKTDFILPPGHEERERDRLKSQTSISVQRSGSHRGASGLIGKQASHKRHHSRSDSLSGFFRGHSRQASRTDSIYTLRQTTTNYKNKIFFWQNKKNATLERKHRTVVPNHLVPGHPKDPEHPNNSYLTNHIRTTKYTALSFIPKNLFEQFHRFANLYFLFIVLLNWVPAISAFGKEISMIPVILVLIVTAIKDLFEDRRRYKSDKRVNYSTCRVYQPGEGRYIKCLWKELRVGDIVHLSNEEQIPADILLLHSSDENGLCYIDTQNLDGETNLKQRERPRGLKQEVSTEFSVPSFRCNLECDMPTTKIYRFHGSLVQPWGERIPVGKDNLILRDCLLKNTDFIEGIVVYAGHESKAMLNNGGPRYKRSKLEKQINREVVWCVVILVVLCLIGATGNGIWNNSFSTGPLFIPVLDFEKNSDPAWEGFLTFWTFIIILQIIIPLSLYVTIELTKLSQVYLIHNDPLMYDSVHRKRVECRALNIPEELGQVQYMFCDKTGTLTENKMVFKRAMIEGEDYGHNSFSQLGTSRAIIPPNRLIFDKLSSLEIQLLVEGREARFRSNTTAHIMQEFFLLLAACNTVIVARHHHRDTMNASGVICSTPGISTAESTLSRPNRNTTLLTPVSVTSSTDLYSRSNTPSPPPSIVSTVSSTAALTFPNNEFTPPHHTTIAPKRPRFLDFARPLSPIHSSAETTPAESPATRQKSLHLPSLLNPFSKLSNYSSSSLNKASRPNTPEVKPPEVRPLYEAESPDELALVDAAFAYQCKLIKRSPTSCVVSLPGDGVVEFEVLHILPFDSVRKRMSVVLRHPITRERTLYCKGADSSMLSRLSRPKNEREEKIIEATGTGLNNYAKTGLRVLVMAKRVLEEEEYQDWKEAHKRAEVALEKRDKLLMESYNRMENKMTLLGATGIEDKLQEHVPETIAKLRAAGIVVWVLTGDKQETAINIAYSCRLFSHDMEIIKLNSRSRDTAESSIRLYLEETTNSSVPPEKRALIVDGKTLIYILDKRANIQHLFLNLTKRCGAVLGCRATPLQKAYIVRIVKEQLKMHTLAIGDGANDVSMIQTAHIGIGISGQEGMQAVMASDFAITRFKFVERLLLVHGHWCYDRLARMVLHFFYKNATFVFVCFWYQLFCGFTGTVMIDQMYLMLFNLLFTSLPPVALGVFDRTAPASVLVNFPHLYSTGRLSTVYKPHSFWVNMAEALYASLVVFFLALGAYLGSEVGIWEFGTLICSQCIMVMLVQLGVETKSWTIVHWLSMVVSVVLYLAFGLSYNAICKHCEGLTNPYWVMQTTLLDPKHYLVLILSGTLSALPRVICRVLETQSDVTRTMVKRKRDRNAERKRTKQQENMNMTTM